MSTATEGNGGAPFHISGVIPRLTAKADMLPRRTEIGIGALMPWAGRLWMVTYLSNRVNSGGGNGLYEISEDFTMIRREESVEGCFANRMLHGPTHQIVIGPHVIDTEGNVRTIPELKDWRLTATMEHLEDPANMFYCIAMDGKFWEVNAHTLESKLLFDLSQELDIPSDVMPHFKGAHTSSGRVFVTNNTYGENDFLGTASDGRLAAWDGAKWEIIERTGFNEVAGQRMGSHASFATGWDRASAILSVNVNGKWLKYRLPKGSRNFDKDWQTEWPRIREVEHERLLMDCHGLFYELSPYTYGDTVWGVVPICRHLRVVPDFCSWQGLLVLAGDHASPRHDRYILAGEPQSGLWFGKTDDLWQFGAPQGWGGPWWETSIKANEPSDPYLMTGFIHKSLHISSDAGQDAEFIVEVDFLGTHAWQEYTRLKPGAGGYVHHEFPQGFSAHWVRITPTSDCTASAQFFYT